MSEACDWRDILPRVNIRSKSGNRELVTEGSEASHFNTVVIGHHELKNFEARLSHRWPKHDFVLEKARNVQGESASTFTFVLTVLCRGGWKVAESIETLVGQLLQAGTRSYFRSLMVLQYIRKQTLAL